MRLSDIIIKPTDSIEIKVAKIGFYALIIAALITGLFQLVSKDKSSSETINYGDFQSSMTGGGIGNTYIYYNVPETATKQAIKEFEELQKRLNQTDDKVELTKQQIELLSQALKDLDQRTSGIEKLPDGRTKFGSMISGTPSILIQEYNLAASYFDTGNYNAALIHSENAIKSYEDSQEKERQTSMIIGSLYPGSLNPEAVSKMYSLGALAAQHLDQKELANQYAKKALDVNPSAENNALYATTLYNLGNYKESMDYIEKAIKAEPNNSAFVSTKETILKKI
ncbi:MAG: hypothetical protein KKG76_00230 [Euryarchaeota archaeon]|nr:hypothetical protein [Euryarchaeota archaeon]